MGPSKQKSCTHTIGASSSSRCCLCLEAPLSNQRSQPIPRHPTRGAARFHRVRRAKDGVEALDRPLRAPCSTKRQDIYWVGTGCSSSSSREIGACVVGAGRALGLGEKATDQSTPSPFPMHKQPPFQARGGRSVSIEVPLAPVVATRGSMSEPDALGAAKGQLPPTRRRSSPRATAQARASRAAQACPTRCLPLWLPPAAGLLLLSEPEEDYYACI